VSLLAWLLLILPLNPGGVGFKLGHHSHHIQGMYLRCFVEIWWWIVMVVAMMLPLIVDSIRVTAVRSLWARRDWAIIVFILGYLVPWMLAGSFISAAIVILHGQRWFHPTIATSLAFGLAAVWQLTAAKKHMLRSCHRTIPIAPKGWRANLDCLWYGWTIGGNCLLNCGALMMACPLSGHNVAVMAGVASISAAERYTLRPRQRVFSAATAVVGLICACFL
jgi:predicted metal-binding membrane protein